jgi:membrane protease YdiL (CAAX protease family)
LAAVFFAIAVGPFIGGIRGVPLYAIWYLFPLIWMVSVKERLSALGANWPGIAMICISVLCGLVMSGILAAINAVGNGTFRFVNVIPELHRDFTQGSFLLFIAAIPIGHIGHELFFRGLIQRQISNISQSQLLGLLIGALLFAWTHTIIFTSSDYTIAYRGVYGELDHFSYLWPVFLFTAFESVGAGLLLILTDSIYCSILFRVSNLMAVIFLIS